MNIEALTLSQALDRFDDPASGMWETLRNGFGVADSPEFKERFRQRIMRIRTTGAVYIVSQPTVCACLIMSVWSKDAPLTGKKFYSSLNALGDTFQKRLDAYKTLVCNIVSIATHSDHQRKGYAKALFQQCIKDYQPAFVVGQTRNPAAEQARSHILHECGYRSWYGGIETIPGSPHLTIECVKRLYNAYYASRNIVDSNIHESGFAHRGYSHILKNTPIDLSTYSPLHAKAFEPVIQYSEEPHEAGMVILSALVSVDSALADAASSLKF